MESKHICNVCGKSITEFNHIGLNKKLLGRSIEKFFCMGCLANFLEVTVPELEVKITEFIAQNCALFKKEEQTTTERLKELQALPLEKKIKLTKQRITEWYTHFDGNVYISFSGGKDSTVLLDIARQIFPDIEAVFADTGLEYPEIREFVKSVNDGTLGYWYDSVDNTYSDSDENGYDVFHDIDETGNLDFISAISKTPRELILNHPLNEGRFDENNNLAWNDKQAVSKCFIPTFTCRNITTIRPEMSFKQVLENYGYPVISKDIARKVEDARNNVRNAVQAFAGKDTKGNETVFRKRYKKWKYLLDSDFKISSKCCDVIKKAPMYLYEEQTGKKPILATMTDESELRQKAWLKTGCNAFGENKRQISQPMSFWTEQDILQYIKFFNLPYSKIYGDLVEEYTKYKRKPNKPTGKLKFTGCQRTGCMFCMFGCHLDKKPNRFQRMAETHPKQYDYCIRPVEENGLGLGEVLDFIGVDYSPIEQKTP